MQRFKTFVHQKRFEKGSIQPSPNLAPPQDEDDWSGTIDHRLVEAHRLKWEKRVDWFVYLAAAAFIIYTVYRWVAP